MISIIIPTFNEEDSISQLVTYLKSHASEEVEVIVCDAGSNDKTQTLSKESGARVVESPEMGRGSQMNFGASLAKGEILFFLHADTYPPKSFVKDINTAVHEGYSAGCYRLSFDDDHLLLRFYSWFTRFDIDYFRFGDQSLFIKKSLFAKLDGFKSDLIVMEDQDIVIRTKKLSSFKIFSKQVVTSARKYRKVGILKLQLIFAIILLRYYLGTPQQKLIHFYKKAIS